MVVYLCAECETEVSRPVVDLVDHSIIRTDPDEHTFSDTTGNPDLVPQGFRIAGSTMEGSIRGTWEDWVFLNPEDLVGTEWDIQAAGTGCCGPRGEELSIDCRNGHKVATERGDCFTVHFIGIDPDRVVATEDLYHETYGLDEADRDVWFDTLESGSIADKRRAITLLGIHEIDSAVPLLGKILRDGPESLRTAAAYSLGHIGGPDALDALTEVLDDEDANIRETVVKAIGGCDVEGINTILLNRLVNESSEDVCRKIGYAFNGAITPAEFREYIDRTSEIPVQRVLLNGLWAKDKESLDALYETIVRTDLPTQIRNNAVAKLRWRYGEIATLGCEDGIIPPSSTVQETLAFRLLDAFESVSESEVRRECIYEIYEEYKNDTLSDDVKTRIQDIKDDPNCSEAVRARAEQILNC